MASWRRWVPVVLLAVGILFANVSIVAQDFGAGRIAKIRANLPQSLWLALALGFLLSPLVWFCEPLLAYLDLDPNTHNKALAYSQMVALGLPAFCIFLALRFHTQGVGITLPFAVSSSIGFVANIPLNYAFIYGEFGAPEMGAEGCGVATAISMWLTLILIVGYVLWSKTLREYLPAWRFVAPQWPIVRETLVLGVPIGLTFFLEVGVFSLIALMIATLGDAAMAAHQIAFNIWDVFYIPMLGLCSAMATRMGHAIGAGWQAGVERSFLVGVIASVLIAATTMAVLFLAPHSIIAVYTDSPEIRELATRLIMLAAFFILIDAAAIVGSFALRAFKETQFPFLVMVISYWLVTLPLGWWLGFRVADNPGDGAAGFWYATIAGIAICALLIGIRVWVVLHRPLPDPATFEPEPI